MLTASPFLTPHSLSTLATRQVSRMSSPHEISRESPDSSASKMIAVLSGWA